MRSLRLLMVTPRYWPLAGDTERVTERLANEFCEVGHPTTILTARWHSDWPETIVHRKAIITRLATAPRGGWATLRYMRAISRWVRKHREDFDLVYVMNLRHDAYAVVGALQATDLPVVLRAQRGGMTGDCHWQEQARFGSRMRKRCQAAAAIIASTDFAAGELLRAGYTTIREINYGVSESEPRTAASRFHARAALAEVNQDLQVAEFAPVAVCVDRLSEGRGLPELIRAWLPIANRWPSAKLWLIGDGPLRDSLYEMVVDLGLRQQIAMPGSFDELSDVFHAADVFVSPVPDFGTTQALVDAMATGLPIVAVDSPDLRETVDDGVHGHLVPADSRMHLSSRIAGLFETTELALQYGLAARRRASECFTLQRSVDEHLALFQQLASSIA